MMTLFATLLLVAALADGDVPVSSTATTTAPETATAPAPASVPAPAPAPPLPTAPGSAGGAATTGGVLPPRRLAVMPRFAYRLGQAGRDVTPAAGFGVGGTLELAYVRRAGGLEAAVGIDFSYDRFATDERGVVTVNGVTETFGSTRVVSETTFVLVHTVAVRVGAWRPFVGLGAGVGIGYLDSAAVELRPGSASQAHALGRATIGVDVAVAQDFSLTLRADYTLVRGASPLVTANGERRQLFGDLLDVAAGVAFRF